MASQEDLEELPLPRRRRRIGCWIPLAALLLLVAALAVAWFNREGIADDFIADELAKRGIEATYKVDRIGGRRQVLRDIVIGDPRRPDFTAEMAEVIVRQRFGYPKVTEIRLLRPRLFGTLRGGKLSFGELDPLIFTGKEGPFEFPDVRLRVTDGRGLLESDYGPVGFKLAGSGHLRGGFSGEIAAVAPRLSGAGCQARGTTLYGRVDIEDERPAFKGPVRFARVACGELAVASGVLQLDGRADKLLTSVDSTMGVRTGAASLGSARLASLAGDTRFSWRDSGLTANYELAGTSLATGPVAVARLDLDGSLRARRNFDRLEIDTEVDGRGVRPGAALNDTLADAAAGTRDTLLGPILERVRAQMAREGRASRLAAELSVRKTGNLLSVVVPQGNWRGTSGETLLALTRFQLASGGGAAPRFSGNFATGGEGLPRIAGRMEQRGGGGIEARLSMAPYAAGASRLAIPELVLVQRPDGAFGFAGQVRATGALPGGRADELVMPVNGNWSRAGGLALWNACTELRFDRLQLANLTLARQRLRLCPARGVPIVRYGPRGLRIAAGAPSLQLAGMLGQTPISIRSGAVGLAYPGALTARQLLVSLGPSATATTFAINDLTAQIGKDISGRFAGTDVKLFSVPLDLLGASGNWRYAGGRLALSDGAFRLVDRQAAARFEPLTAQGATLVVENNKIDADALLREAATGRAVTRVDLRHDLSTGRGEADLAFDSLTFDDGFQPTALTAKALGVVANVRGTVTGTGRIAWSEQGVTSTGRFSSDSLDFAAAFGPVKGASGTIEFTDLLGLTTAPGQRLRVASINPGIEVTDGEIVFELRNGQVLAVQGGTWPFMGGTLTMRPIDINLGASEARRYVLEIVGLDAARFVERMELNNISATGIFDGTIPIVFDAPDSVGGGNGRVEGGLLTSRPPGGNVSYIGELTYKDLSPMANFAFDTLRSLDYTQMTIAMDGSLTGEMVTRVRFDGVKQGAGTKQNILTRAVAGLPIRFDVNIRAPFYSLITSLKALYDPALQRDPRDLGLLDARGNVIRRETTAPPPELTPGDLIPDDPPIQPSESERVR